MLISCQVTKTQRSSDVTAQWNDSSSLSLASDRRCYSIGQTLQNRGLSSGTVQIILDSWGQGTKKQYKYAWEKWYMWNYIRYGNPFQTTEITVIQFLNYLFQSGKSYSVLNSHKAMLLQTLPFFGNLWCKDCPLIGRFMKGVYFKRRPKPRYLFTWDVSCVLKYLSSLFPLNVLTLKLLTFKVTALIALATASRAQTLVSMDLDHMVIVQNCVIFSFPNVLKLHVWVTCIT